MRRFFLLLFHLNAVMFTTTVAHTAAIRVEEVWLKDMIFVAEAVRGRGARESSRFSPRHISCKPVHLKTCTKTMNARRTGTRLPQRFLAAFVARAFVVAGAIEQLSVEIEPFSFRFLSRAVKLKGSQHVKFEISA